MTITYFDKIAILPKRCDKCNRLFIFEPYNSEYVSVCMGDFHYHEVTCKFCVKKKRNGGKK